MGKLNNKLISLFSKIICGPRDEIFIVIGMSFSYLLFFLSWVFFINDLYTDIYKFNFLFYMFLLILIILQYNYLRCYFSDPGIIPKCLEAEMIENNEKILNDKQKKFENVYEILANSNNNSKDINVAIDKNIGILYYEKNMYLLL